MEDDTYQKSEKTDFQDDDESICEVQNKRKPLKIVAYNSFPSRTMVKNPFRKPVFVKYGIIAYSWKTRRWLLLQRKYTDFFLKIVKGDYRNSELSFLLNQVTTQELKILKNLSKTSFNFNNVFDDIFPDDTMDDLIYAKERFLGNGEFFIKHKSIKEQSEVVGWEIPCEPLLNDHENPIDCALRAFKKSVGWEITFKEKSFLGRDPFISNDISNVNEDQRCESRYWLVIWMEEPPKNSDDEYNFKWCTEEETKEVLDRNKVTVIEEAKEFIKENFLF